MHVSPSDNFHSEYGGPHTFFQPLGEGKGGGGVVADLAKCSSLMHQKGTPRRPLKG